MAENIEGYPGYHITKEGEVFSRRAKSFRGVFYLLKSYTHKGSPCIMLSDLWGFRYNFKISRLVAQAYIPNPQNLPFVCHKDNNPFNNYYTNLYWGTQSDNITQCYADRRRPKGEYHPSAILSSRERVQIISFYQRKSFSRLELSEMYGVSPRCISKVIKPFKI